MRCKHQWQIVGPAPSFNGERCQLWACVLCGKTWELFYDVDPNKR